MEGAVIFPPPSRGKTHAVGTVGTIHAAFLPSVSPTRIPKKTQPPIDGIPGLSPPVSLSQNGARSNSFDDGGSNDPPLSLPDGVQLPPTVTPGMIDGRLRRAFFDLTPAQMRDVLTEYDDAVKEKGGEIRNRTAYLFGVVKRYKTMTGDMNPTPQGSLSDKVLVSKLSSPTLFLDHAETVHPLNSIKT